MYLGFGSVFSIRLCVLGMLNFSGHSGAFASSIFIFGNQVLKIEEILMVYVRGACVTRIDVSFAGFEELPKSRFQKVEKVEIVHQNKIERKFWKQKPSNPSIIKKISSSPALLVFMYVC